MSRRIEIDWTSYERRRAWQAAPIQGLREQRGRWWRGFVADVFMALVLGASMGLGVITAADFIAKRIAG